MITSLDLKFLRVAEKNAVYSGHERVAIGACVTNRKHIISTGHNGKKTHPEQFKYNQLLPYPIHKPRLHAEIDALVRAGDSSVGATLYIFRRGRDGAYRNCKPCPACMAKIADSGIKRVVHTIYNGIVEINKIVV